MKKSLLLLLFSFNLLIGYILPQSNKKAVLTRTDLEFISLIRISDIYSILPQLDLYTIDRYRHTAVSAGLFVNSPRDIIVLINGVRTNFGIWNKTNLSQFPIHPLEIDSIIISDNPILYKGEFSSGILIDLITKVPTDGLSFKATYATGNEAGDPGPYVYTEHFSNNVDQFGPNTYFTANYGSEKLKLAFNFIDQVSPTTDPAVLKRVKNFIFNNYQVRYSGFSLNASTESNLGKHNLFSAFSKTGQSVIGFEYGDDLFFIDELSNEFPYKNENFILSSGNNFQIYPGGNLIADANLNYNSMNQSKFSNDFQFNSADLWLYSKVGYQSSLGSINYLAGTSFTYHNMRNKLTDFNYSRRMPSVFASLDTESIKNMTTRIDAVLRFGGNSSGMFICIDNELIINEKHQLSFSVSYDSLFNIQNSLDYRISRGYTFNNEYDTPMYSGNSEASQTSLNISYIIKPDESNSIVGGIDFSSYNKFSFQLNDFVYHPDNSEILNEQSELFNGVNGWTWELNFSITNKINKKFMQKFYYRYKSALSDNEIFNEAIKRFPGHKMFYSIYFLPFSNLSVYMTINYSSAKEWIEYRNIISEGDEFYRSKLKNLFLINCGVTKIFWSERIKISASIENLLNNRIQYHPVGGSFDLTFFLKGEIDLKSIIPL